MLKKYLTQLSSEEKKQMNPNLPYTPAKWNSGAFMVLIRVLLPEQCHCLMTASIKGIPKVSLCRHIKGKHVKLCYSTTEL